MIHGIHMFHINLYSTCWVHVPSFIFSHATRECDISSKVTAFHKHYLTQCMRKVTSFLLFNIKQNTTSHSVPIRQMCVGGHTIQRALDEHRTRTLFGTKCQSFIRDMELREGQRKTIKLPHVAVRPDRRSFHPMARPLLPSIKCDKTWIIDTFMQWHIVV